MSIRIERIYTDADYDEWLTLFANRNEVADWYADRLELIGPSGGWAEVNAAILRRWSPAGLRYIKERAWRIVERRRSDG